ncbi:MAG: GlsB/YeaQ/YmgE family stress response membrane protein [Chloroflexota bacterium]
MGLLSWIILGAIAGWVANMIMGGGEGVIMTIIVGIVGGLLGGFIARNVFHIGTANGLNIGNILIAIGGAVIVLFVWRTVMSRRSGRASL